MGDFTEFGLAAKGVIMTKEKDMTGKKSKEKTEKNEEKETTAISEELVRWMTEGTNPNSTPRSDCG